MPLSDRWSRVEELFHAARRRAPEERSPFLVEACGGDDALRREVESLLAHEAGTLNVAAPAVLPATASPLVGRRIGAYFVSSLLGSGGMGEVYRARDSRLGRDVALKILPGAFSHDAERLARFERESRLLASLNHPNIATVYGAEHSDGVYALAMELVEGQTLADRLADVRGSGFRFGPRTRGLAVADVISIAAQLVDALDVAHERGIVHRDLKPANIKLTHEGVLKVLDFGLAKAIAPAEGDAGISAAPTVTIDGTHAGMILGTPAYMSPEQARGAPVDKRVDIWAFGCVLYEMLTGTSPFGGDTISDTIAAVIEREPDWAALPQGTPYSLEHLVRHCLYKDPKHRLRDIGDARASIDLAMQPRRHENTPSGGGKIWWWIAATLVILIAAAAPRWLGTRPELSQRRALLTLPTGIGESFVRDVAVSPDGAYVAYIAGPPGDSKTYLRAVTEKQSRVVSDLPTGAPFFSPDSQWLGSFDAGFLKKLPVRGGSAITLAAAPDGRGGAWGSDGSIVFSPAARTGLLVLRPAADKPETLTLLDVAHGETSHRFPSFLPDGKTILFSIEGNRSAQRRLGGVTLDKKPHRVIAPISTLRPLYVPTGYLAYLENDTLSLVRFDAKTQQVTGTPVGVLGGVGSFATSAGGMLVYGRTDAAAARVSSLVWVARDGTLTSLRLQPGRFDHPRLSPDGRRVAYSRPAGADSDIWIYDIARDTEARLTFDGASGWPCWSADGSRIVYASNRVGSQWDIFAKPSAGNGAEVTILNRRWTQLPQAVSPDGIVAYTETDPERGDMLWTVSLNDSSRITPLLDSTPGEMMPSFSPDGRWVAYVSPESGRNEVYVQGRHGTPGKWQITTEGGTEPAWSLTGHELYYRAGNKLFAVDVETSPGPSFGKARVLFQGSFVFGATQQRQYDLSRDGQRFLMLKTLDDNRQSVPLDVVVNWFTDIERRIDAPK